MPPWVLLFQSFKVFCVVRYKNLIFFKDSISMFGKYSSLWFRNLCLPFCKRVLCGGGRIPVGCTNTLCWQFYLQIVFNILNIQFHCCWWKRLIDKCMLDFNVLSTFWGLVFGNFSHSFIIFWLELLWTKHNKIFFLFVILQLVIWGNSAISVDI